jgi:hypothetical protein
VGSPLLDRVVLSALPGPSTSGSRAGGAPPVCLEARDDLVVDHRYLLTLSPTELPWLGEQECSVFVRRGFSVWGEDVDYPRIGLTAVLHEPSPRGSLAAAALPGLSACRLAVADAPTGRSSAGVPDTSGHAPLVRAGGVPDLVRQLPLEALPVVQDGWTYLFAVDDDGWPEGCCGDLPFSTGAVYFFGEVGADGVVRRVLPGVVQF